MTAVPGPGGVAPRPFLSSSASRGSRQGAPWLGPWSAMALQTSRLRTGKVIMAGQTTGAIHDTFTLIIVVKQAACQTAPMLPESLRNSTLVDPAPVGKDGLGRPLRMPTIADNSQQFCR